MQSTMSTSKASLVSLLAFLAYIPFFGFSLSTTPSGMARRDVYVITHGAGRMGKLLALQIREFAELSGTASREFPRIRAVVRSEEEATSVQCDLGGMMLTAGEAASCIALDWLETVVIENVDDEKNEKLRDAFEGATAAILCDQSHNEIVWNQEDDPNEGPCSISVPSADNIDLSGRILAEIDAAAASSTLQHVVMRSSMGLSVPSNSDAAIAMGGEATLSGPRNAEQKIREAASLKDKYTILRLGALTDDAGMVPLIFGSDDDVLLKRLDSTHTRRPPILSRADAARVSAFVLRDCESYKGVTVDCAWHPKYGRSSVGTEEAVRAAGLQDLKKEILERRGGFAPVEVESQPTY